MTRKIVAIVAGVMLVGVGIRYAIAVRNSEPAYIMVAGKNYIQEEWNYCSRFSNETNPKTAMDRARNYINNSLFNSYRPVFGLENKIFGHKIEKGDAFYDQYVKRVQEIRINGWDYVDSSYKDGRGMIVIKDRQIVQKID